MAQGKKKQKKENQKPYVNTLPLYVVLAILFVAYFLFQSFGDLSAVLGPALFAVLIILVVLEVANSVKEEGVSRNLIEIAIAVIFVIVLWVALRYFLHTASPLDVVPSCSMLNALNRGDMILVQGVNQTEIKAPVVNVTSQQFAASFSNINNEALECVAYNNSAGRSQVSQIVQPGFKIGLLRSNNRTYSIVNDGAQTGLVKYTCGAVNITYQNGTTEKEASTVAITIGNTTITGDRNNSIVVYQTESQDLFYQEGDSYIVHRAYAIINASGTYYVLTKGDNNPGLDIQYFNSPANMSSIEGKVTGSVPYIGYLKLILSNNFVEPTGCNYVTQN